MCFLYVVACPLTIHFIHSFMFYVVFCRYDSWDEYGPESGRGAYITDNRADADRHWYDINHVEPTDDYGFNVRRGDIYGPFDSLDDTECASIIRVCDDVDFGPAPRSWTRP